MNVRIGVDFSSIKQTSWHEYAIRFFLGGIVTIATGLIAKKFGPGIGGLFLAFPAIFPASATLIEKHAKEKEGNSGARARTAVAEDAAGAAMGAIGLLFFALVVWKGLNHLTPWIVLTSATLAWLAVSALIWLVRTKLR
jgi:hypothetical protein